MISILVAGKKALNYNRTQVLIKGLEKLDNVNLSQYEFGVKNKETGQKLKKLAENVDYILIPPFRHTDIKFIKNYSDKPIIFDPLVSNYLTKVVDYKHWWKAPLKYFSDALPMRQSDILVADTEHHKQYFAKKFKIPLSKIVVVPVGMISDDFKPSNSENNKDTFKVGFYGSFVPLQGTDKIIAAALELKSHNDIVFELIGTGATFKKAQNIATKNGLNNIRFLGWVNYESLADKLHSYDLCLGIFGDSKKADFVVPNKIYHYAALNKCIITKDTPGIREVFTGDDDIFLTSNKPKEIAKAILALKDDEQKRKSIAQNGHELIAANYNEISIAQRLVDFLIDNQ